MDLFDQIRNFYQNYKEISLLIVGGIVTLLLTRLVPYFISKTNELFEWVMRKIGGRLAYNSIQGKYLSWVVLQNQDLNLTGVIGSGPKPKLEQIFISLRMTKGITDTTDKDEDSQFSNYRLDSWKFFEQKSKQLITIIRRIVKNLFFPFFSGEYEHKTYIFQPSQWWKIRQIGLNEHLLTYFLDLFFVVAISSFGLFLFFFKLSNFSQFAMGFLLGYIIASFLFLNLDHVRKGVMEFAIWFVYPILLIIAKLFQFLFQHHNLLPFFIGCVAGATMIRIASSLPGRRIFGRGKNKEETAKDIGKLLLSHDYIAILGKPGSGKSTYLQYIALTFAQEKAGNRNLRKSSIVRKRFGITRWYLPILIPLRKTSKFINTTAIHTGQNLCIESFRQEVLPSELRDDFSNAFIRFLLKQGRCLLLFDGLDEVANEHEFRIVVNEIKGLVSQYPKNKFLITSRYTGWRGGVGSTFLEAEANDLTEKQIKVFANNWYRAIEYNRRISTSKTEDNEEKAYREQRSKIKAEQLIETVENIESIRNLAKNPLLLSMICFVHYNKSLPKERLSLYEDCSRLLLDQWDVEKGLPQDDIPLNLQRKEILIEEIAFSLHSGKVNSGIVTKEASRDEIIDIIRNTLKKFDLDLGQADTFFQKLINRSGLLIAIEQYKNTYSFSHLTFQEFYTAKYLHRNNIDIFSTVEPSKLSETNLSSWWREVIILFSAMKKQPSQIIHQLCCTNTEDLLNIRIQIASQCFIEATEPPPAQIEKQLMQELLRIRSHGQLELLLETELSGEGRAYLLRFAMASDFYEHSLNLLADQLTTESDRKSLVQTLLLLTKSPDRDIQKSTIKAILNILERIKDYSFISQENLAGFIDILGIDVMLIDILEYLVLANQKIESVLADKLEKEVFGPLFQNVLEDNQVYGNLKIAERVSEIIESEVFSNLYNSLQETAVNSLKRIFKSKIDYRHKYGFDRTMRKYTVALTKLLLFTSSEEKKKSYRDQIKEMLYKGSAFQQVYAIFLVAEVYKNDLELKNELLQKITSPSYQIRLASISVLPKLQLSESQIELILRRLKKILSHQSRFQKRFAGVKKFIWKLGTEDIRPDERIQIAGVLTYFSKGSTKLLDLIPLGNEQDFYANRFEWSELMVDLNAILTNREIKTLFDFCRTVLADTEKSISFISYMLVFSKNMAQPFKHELCSYLCDDERKGALDVLDQYVKPEISLSSDEYNKIKHGLLNEYYWDANAAYKILESNGLLEDAIYIS